MISDGVLELRRLLSADELTELCDRLGPPLRATLAVEDLRGERLAGTPAGVTAVTRELACLGEPIGRVIAAGPGAEAAAAALASAIEIAAHHAQGRVLASNTHAAAMDVNFAELTAQNQRLAAAVARFEQAERARSTFLSTMSHELRTPLTSVMGYTEILLEGLAGPVTPEQLDHLRTIMSKAEQLLEVISAVLDVARASSGSVGGDRGEVDLGRLATEVLASFGESAGRRGLRLERALAPAIVRGDRRQLRQVLVHLVSNATKFSHDGGTVELEVVAGAGGGGRVRVRDHGVGISAEALPRVFEPFFQADSSSTRAHGGSGLGLTVARAFVEAHGGQLEVEATPGGGATFTVVLPGDPAP
ncbi:MAG: HAMP domain-containing sensor histidine kinase [Kofleriaceae bacterium]